VGDLRQVLEQRDRDISYEGGTSQKKREGDER